MLEWENAENADGALIFADSFDGYTRQAVRVLFASALPAFSKVGGRGGYSPEGGGASLMSTRNLPLTIASCFSLTSASTSAGIFDSLP